MKDSGSLGLEFEPWRLCLEPGVNGFLDRGTWVEENLVALEDAVDEKEGGRESSPKWTLLCERSSWSSYEDW
jgi:hypothetical protein